MKKLLSTLLAIVLVFGTFAMCVSADNITLRNPVPATLRLAGSTLVTDEVLDLKGSSRTLDASAITAVSTVATTQDNGYKGASDGAPTNVKNFTIKIQGAGGASRLVKNSFVWEFDFCVDSMPTTANTNFLFICFSGDMNYQKRIVFKSLGYKDDIGYYRLHWGDSGNSWINNEKSGDTFAGGKSMLQVGKTYHLKLEFDVPNKAVWATFSNPYIRPTQWYDPRTSESQPMYTKTTKNTVAPTGWYTTYADALTSTWKQLPITIAFETAASVTMTNETFKIEKFREDVPALAVSDNSVTATAKAVSTAPSFNFTNNVAPALICAVYDSSKKLVGVTVSNPTRTFESYKEQTYDATVSGLADGDYTVKAFVWNNLKEIVPYEGAMAEGSITVTGGVAALN